MNGKKARKLRQESRQPDIEIIEKAYEAYTKWTESEPPKWRWIKHRKWEAECPHATVTDSKAVEWYIKKHHLERA